MSVYDTADLNALLRANPYPGRGIVVGKSADGRHAVILYFIMGRSENSRNRIFEEVGQGLRTRAFDESRLADPSLIIYSPLQVMGNVVIVTNGDQTDTIYEYMEDGARFSDALDHREFEPDAPNFTPRISAALTFENGDFTYQMSILKSADEAGSACNRFLFSYAAVPGVGQFLHTYNGDGDPLPTFTGEPERVAIGNDIDETAAGVWNSLNPENKISLYVRYISLVDGSVENRLFNKNF